MDQLPDLVLGTVMRHSNPCARVSCLMVSKRLHAAATPTIPYRSIIAPLSMPDEYGSLIRSITHMAHEVPCSPNLVPGAKNELLMRVGTGGPNLGALAMVSRRFTPESPLEELTLYCDEDVLLSAIPPVLGAVACSTVHRLSVRFKLKPLSLESLASYMTKVHEGMPMASSFPRVTALDLVDGMFASIAGIVTSFPRLTSLGLSYCGDFSDWERLSDLPALTDLQLMLLHILHPVDWRVVKTLTRLRSLSLRDTGSLEDILEAVTPLTNLTSLHLELSVHLLSVSQETVDRGLGPLRALKVLRLAIRDAEIHVPESLTGLVCVQVPRATLVPCVLSGITRVVIDGITSGRVRPFVLPPNLTHLHVPSDILGAAVRCHLLRHLFCTPSSQGFGAKEQFAILAPICRADVWPCLESLSLIQNSKQGTDTGMWISATAAAVGRPADHAKFCAKLLMAYARPTCPLTHVTLYTGGTEDNGALAELCLMPMLSSATIVGVPVTVAYLLGLIMMPRMLTVELVDTGMDAGMSTALLQVTAADRGRVPKVLHRHRTMVLPSMDAVLDMA